MDEKECKLHRLIADVLIRVKSAVLLVRYKTASRQNHQDGWFVPTTELQFAERPDDAVLRLIREQLNYYMANIRLGYIESQAGSCGSPWYLIFHYKVVVDERPHMTCASRIKELSWFPLDNLPAHLSVTYGEGPIDVIRKTLKPEWTGAIQQSG